MASWLDQWAQDKQQRDQQAQAAQQNPQTGQVNFKVASAASRPQYANPIINQQDPTGQNGYQWQKDILGNMSGKGIGRSNDAKFATLTSRLGMSPGQASDFRNFLNFQENSQKQAKMTKNGTLDGRSSVPLGSGIQLQNGLFQNILDNYQKNNTNQVNQAINTMDQQAQQQANLKQAQAQQAQVLKNPQSNQQEGAVSKFLDGVGSLIPKPAYNALNDFFMGLNTQGQRFDNQLGQTFAPNLNTKANAAQAALVNQQLAKNPNNYTAQVNAKALQDATKQASTPLEKAVNLAGGLAGNMLPYAVGDGALGVAEKALPAALKSSEVLNIPFIKAALQGGASGLAGAGIDLGVKSGIDGEKITPGQAVNTLLTSGALGAGTGAVLSPVMERIAGKLMQGKPVEQVAKEENVPVEHVQQVHNNLSNVLSDPAKVTPEQQALLNQYPKANNPAPTMASFVPNEPPKVDVPNMALDNMFNFAQSGGVKARGAMPNGNLPRYTQEALANKADEILNRVIPQNNKPVGYYQDLWNKTANGDSSIFNDQINKIYEQAHALAQDMPKQEQDFIDKYMQQRLNEIGTKQGPVAMLANKGDFHPSDMQTLMRVADNHEQAANAYVQNHPDYQAQMAKVQQTADQHAGWQASKQLKDEYTNLRKTLDGISYSPSDKENFGDIPKTFKTNGGKGIDISKAAELLGAKSPEEAVSYLNKLAEANRTQMKDIVTSKGADQTPINDLEAKLKNEYYANNPEAQKALDLISQGKGNNSVLEEARNAFENSSYHQSNLKLIDALQQDLSKMQNPTKEDIYQALRQPDDPQTLNHLVDVAMKDMKDFKGTSLLEALKSDPRIKQQAQKLKSLGGNAKQEVAATKQVKPNTPTVPSFEELMNSLKEEKTQKTQSATDRLASLVKPKQAEAKVLPRQEPPKPDAKNAEVIKNNPQAEPSNSGLLRMNLQEFDNSHTAPPKLFATDKPVESKSAIDQVKNPIKRQIDKFIENYANSTHSAKVAEHQTLMNAADRYEKAGAPKKAAQLRQQAKDTQKHGSQLEMSIANEKTAGNKTRQFLEEHFHNLQKALGTKDPKALSDALHYQAAKNIDYIWKKNPDYNPGKEWDRGRVNQLINQEVSNPKLKDFNKAFRAMTKAHLDEAKKANLISQKQYEGLMKNPHYIPLSRDMSPTQSNVARGLNDVTTGSSLTPGMHYLQELGGGHAEALYKNPMESMVNHSYSLFKNIAKSDTANQMYRLAKLDKEGNLFQEVSNKSYKEAPQKTFVVPTAKGTKYVQLQSDLMNMYKQNDLPLDLNVLGNVTRLFSAGKVRSLQYQMTGVPRDLAEGYLKGQINNPLRYAKELVSAAKNHAIDAKQAGAVFEHAYNDGMGGVNQDKLISEFAKRYNVQPVKLNTKEGLKNAASLVTKALDKSIFLPARVLGQMSDELPRAVEVKMTGENFNKKYGTQMKNISNQLGKVNQQLEDAKGATDPFDPRLQGIDKLQAQKSKLENALNQFDNHLKREQTYRGRDIMNFAQMGRSGIAKHIKQYAAFANTGTQSKYKLARTFVERPVATIAKAALLTAPIVYAEQAFRQNMSGSDKSIYDNTPDYIKQYNYVFVDNGKVYTLPKIQELALFTDPIEAALTGDKSALVNSEQNAMKEAVPYQLGNLAKGVIRDQNGQFNPRKNADNILASTAAEPIADWLANQKIGFNHNPISYADTFGRKNPKANSWTLDAYKKALGNKPNADYAQYLTEQYGGDAGKYMEQLVNLAQQHNKSSLQTAIQNLNPLQDRAYGPINAGGLQVFKSPYKKSAVTKK